MSLNMESTGKKNKGRLYNRTAAEDLFVRHNGFFILTHSKPDGDAVSSACALLQFLRENGKTADLYFPDTPADIYIDFLPDNIYIGDKISDELSSYQTTVALDTGNKKRIGTGDRLKYNFLPKPVINIDHHPDNTEFGDYNFVYPGICSTSAILYELFRNIPGFNISPTVATLLTAGIISDTGALRFQNTSARTFSIISNLISLGADYNKVIRAICYSGRLNYIKMKADLILNYLQVSPSGRYAWIAIPTDMLKKYQVDISETEGLIDSIRGIKDVEIIGLLYKMKNGIKISLRSKNEDIPIASIARKFNGGGHELAAGGLIKVKNMHQAEEILLEEVEKLLNS